MAESNTLKIEKLNGNNFATWKYNVKLLLMQKGLWNIAQGKETKPDIKTEDATKAESIKLMNDWELRSDQAYSIIAINIDKFLQVHVQSTTDPKEAWNFLKKQFEMTSISHIVRLSRRFYASTMREDEDLEEFLTKMTTLAQELRELNEDISSKKFATVILGSLPESYDSFLTSFNARPIEELNWDNVKS